MTIKQLSKIPMIQGLVILEEYDEGKDEYKELWSSATTSGSVVFPKEYQNRKIAYAYAAPRDGYSAIVIELFEEEEV